MSANITDAAALALCIEHAADHRRMVHARRDVVARARATVFPRPVSPANDMTLEAA